MDSTNLNNLSKDELIQIINNLHQKFQIGAGKIGSMSIDYVALLEAASDIIFVLDSQGTVVYINSAWKEFFPSWRGKNTGEHFSKYIPTIEHERAAQVFNEVLKKGKNFQNEILKTYNESGQKIYMTASFSPIKSDSGEIVGLIGIMKNITEKHLAEKKAKEYSRILEIKVKEQLAQASELKGLRDFNEDIISHAPIGIFVMDISGIVIATNPALRQLMGHAKDYNLVGVNLLNEKSFAGSELGKLYENCRSEKRTLSAFNIPYRTLTSERDLIINATVVPLMDDSENIEKVIFMVEDHTEQAVITNRVYEAEKLSALGILASGVASELKNSINKMVMDLNFVDNNLEEGSPSGAYIEALHHELKRIKNITEQLTSLSTADDENKDICDLNKILTSHQVEVMLKRLRSEGFDITVEPAQKEATVRANQNQLQQLLVQFIENAEEAMPSKGSIHLAVATKKSTEGEFAILSIADTGIGIPEENLQKIFQPFFTTKGKQATGLGLMIATAIVQNLGGNIGVKSAPGAGTTFRIVLPMAEKTS